MQGKGKGKGKGKDKIIIIRQRRRLVPYYMPRSPPSFKKKIVSLSLSVSVSNTAAPAPSSSVDHFLKDGRKISVGDCALFKPPQDSAPLVGIIRWLRSDKLVLRVNWLYRPIEVKLGEGIALEASPNEVFYSFQGDEIPVASLLHPCKVAFLPKGVELPLGISSFVCRRVYDIPRKCVWWLIDQDYYTNDQKVEVDQLLYKTHLEMHLTVQQPQGAHSPKLVKGSAASSPLKHSPDSIRSGSSNFSSQSKGKKRDRVDSCSEPRKRERSLKADDGDSRNLRSEKSMKLEIAKITEKGGLVDSQAVERLVLLMQPEKSERKIDLMVRSMLAGIIAATEKFDCLSQFVQLRGVPVLDEWLQEVHKGKIGDLANGEKSVEDFLLVLLCALDKLPVNLNALQMCNIGKSVNHLRCHKNSEIQKKARSLVDTWKKRVEAEMSINDKSASRPESIHAENTHSRVSSDAAIRSSVTHHSSLKSTPVKPAQEESNFKSRSANPGVTRSVASPTMTNCKNGQSRISVNGGTAEQPQTTLKEERSSGSSQSLTNSQCSSEQAKSVVFSGKDEARSPAVLSKCSNKLTVSGSKLRKLATGLQGTATSGAKRETEPNRISSAARVSVGEKTSHGTNATVSPATEGNSHKLIVKIPNRGRGPAQSTNGGSTDDYVSRNSRTSSPALSEKHESSDGCVRRRCDTLQPTDFRGTTSNLQHKSNSVIRRLSNVSKVTLSPSRNEMKSKRALDPSFSSMNALIESCAKFAEANASLSAGDDVGMNLLASVATGEISKSRFTSPAVSPDKNSSAATNSCRNDTGSQKPSNQDNFNQQHCLSSNGADADKHNVGSGGPKGNNAQIGQEAGVKGDSLETEKGSVKSSKNMPEQDITSGPPVSPACFAGRSACNGAADILNGGVVAVKDESNNEVSAAIRELGRCSTAEDKVMDASLNGEAEKRALGDAAVYLSSEVDDGKNKSGQGLQSNTPVAPNSLVILQSDSSVKEENPAMDSSVQEEKPAMDSSVQEEKPAIVSSDASRSLAADNSKEVKSDITDDVGLCHPADQERMKGLDDKNDYLPTVSSQEESGGGLVDMVQSNSCKDVILGYKEAFVCDSRSRSSAVQISCSGGAAVEGEVLSSIKETELNVNGGVKQENGASAAGNLDSSSGTGGFNVDAKLEGDGRHNDASGAVNLDTSAGTGGLDVNSKLKFDLNEGLDVDEGKSGCPVKLGASSVTVCAVNPLQVPISCSPGILSTSEEVTAVAKEPFIPPGDVDLGWRGSAATSAFHRAEPRKVLEMPIAPTKTCSDVIACKQGRPPLDIDLNVADDNIFLDSGDQAFASVSYLGNISPCELVTTSSLHSSGGLDLDLNKVDEAPDAVRNSGGYAQGLEFSTAANKRSSSRIFKDEAECRRGFDLNNGPVMEDSSAEDSSYSQHARSNISHPVPLGPMIGSSAATNFFSQYPSGTSYAVSVTPSALPDRAAFPVAGIGGLQRVMGGPASNLSFNPDVLRGSVLSSSPAIRLQSAPFQYPVFPLGTSFPVATSSLPGGSSGYMNAVADGRISALPPQLVGTAAAVPFQYPHAFLVSHQIPNVCGNALAERNQKRAKQGLDLNSGPGGPDAGGIDESVLTSIGRMSAARYQALLEEQNRFLSRFKKKEAEGGWNMD